LPSKLNDNVGADGGGDGLGTTVLTVAVLPSERLTVSVNVVPAGK
jgi:hypothetical protein